MLDPIVHIQITEVQRIRPEAAAEHVGGVFADEEAEGGREVVRRADLGVELAEGDAAAVAGEDACGWRTRNVWVSVLFNTGTLVRS